MKRFMLLLVLFMFTASCATVNRPKSWDGSYEDFIASCKDYKDVAAFMNTFVYDWSRGNPIQSPKKTFQSGQAHCVNAAWFARCTLAQLGYDTKIVHIIRTGIPHFACAFWVNGELFIIDYGSATLSKRGIHGPLKNLEQWANFYTSSTGGYYQVIYRPDRECNLQ